MDLHRFQLLLNDACLFHGDLLSTGISTHLFRYELAGVFIANTAFLMFGNGLSVYVENPNIEQREKKEQVINICQV